jgi:uncharacterized protein DUF1585/uncharacterized protein DUF1549/uncharacterized protein DUF1592
VRRSRLLIFTPAVIAASFAALDAKATPSLDDYRHFRALSIDLVGRVPTRDEIAAFEAPGFDLPGWVDTQLAGAGYAERLTRLYMDLMRLQVSPVFNLTRDMIDLRRETILGPDGAPVYVYFRGGQRRARVETDGDFCLTPAETGYQFPQGQPPIPFPSGAKQGTPVSQAVLDQYTVVVKPWWLYGDYRTASPTDLYDPTTWATKHPGFVPYGQLLVEPDGKTPTASIRVCREEAQSAPQGHVYTSGRKTRVTADGGGPPDGRFTYPPADDGFAIKNTGAPVDCSTQAGWTYGLDCGCGVGLEHCFPSSGPFPDTSSLYQPALDALGTDQPIDDTVSNGGSWLRLWWGEEARHFMAYVFGQDRDFRDLLEAPYSFVNGPLAQFYGGQASSSCCGSAIYLGYTQPDALFAPSAVPSGLLPHDTTLWQQVPNRGPHASGLLTTSIFLSKFGTRRARAHVLYNAFLCKDFIAPANLQLPPSTDPNLMTRPGCSTCHATLEPMASYFTRVIESDWMYLPTSSLPEQSTECKLLNDAGAMPAGCTTYYDPAFADSTHAVLRGGYPDTVGGNGGPSHADAGPIGLAKEIESDPGFAACVAQNVASSFLGRALSRDDAALAQSLTATFVADGYHMRALVKALVLSDAYARSNNLASVGAP